MSHRTTVKTSFKDLVCLKRSAETLKGKCEIYPEPVKARGSDMLAKLRLRDWYYDSQVDREGMLHGDSDDLHRAKGIEALDELKDLYAENVITDWCIEHGYRVQSRSTEEGKVILEYAY